MEDDYLNPIVVSKVLVGNILTITPQKAMDYNTRYTITLPADALKDSYGHTMEDAYSSNFITATSSPEVVFAFPGNDMDDIAIDTNIKMQYNQSVLDGPTYGDIAIYGPDSKKIAASVSRQGEWLSVDPTVHFAKTQHIRLIVPRGAVMNDKGEAQQEDYTLEFTTGKTIESENNTNTITTANTSDLGNQDNDQAAYTISRKASADGKSSAIIDIDKKGILKQSLKGEAVVTLDLTDVVRDDKAIQINLSESAIEQLRTSHMGYNIVTGKGDVRIPAELIAALVSEGKSSISITIAENNKKFTASGSVSDSIYDFSITSGGVPVTRFKPEVIVTLPIDKSKVGKAKRVIVCVYDEETQNWQPVGGVANIIKGSVTFGAKHFSTYAAFETAKHFDDVTSEWAKEKIEILASRNLILGNNKNIFLPEVACTRAEFTALIVRSLYTELSKSKVAFKDVEENAWYATSIETAYEMGIVNGIGHSLFDPKAIITREQLAIMAYKLFQYKTGTEATYKSSNTFKDQLDISIIAEEAVNFVANTKIMTGSSGRFEPKRSATRQEAAVVLYRLLEYMGEL